MQLFLGLNLLFVGRFESDPSSSESGSGSEQEEKPKLKKEKEKKKKSPEKKRKSSEPSPSSKPPKKKAKVAVSPPFFSLLMFSVNVGNRKNSQELSERLENFSYKLKMSFYFFFCLKSGFRNNTNFATFSGMKIFGAF